MMQILIEILVILGMFALTPFIAALMAWGKAREIQKENREQLTHRDTEDQQ